MTAKIIKCDNDKYWYKNLIGEEFKFTAIIKRNGEYILENRIMTPILGIMMKDSNIKIVCKLDKI